MKSDENPPGHLKPKHLKKTEEFSAESKGDIVEKETSEGGGNMPELTEEEKAALQELLRERRERKAEEERRRQVEGQAETIANSVHQKITPEIQKQIEDIKNKVSSQDEAIKTLKENALCKDEASCKWLMENAPNMSKGGLDHSTAQELLDCPTCGPEIRKAGQKDGEIRKAVYRNLTDEEKRDLLSNLSDEDLELAKERFQQKYELKPKK